MQRNISGLGSLLKKPLSLCVMTVFVFFLTWWVCLQFISDKSSLSLLFTDTYGILAGLGFFIGLFLSFGWGGVKSYMGKSLLFFSLGLGLQCFGQAYYSYYFHAFGVEIPYPSIGDIGFFGSIPAYLFGLHYLSLVTGAKLRLQVIMKHSYFLIAPLSLIVLSYVFFFRSYTVDFSELVKFLLDIGYPFGQIIYVSFAWYILLLSKGVLGGIMKPRIYFLLIALVVQFVADYTFLLQAQSDAWVAGNLNELFYLVAYFVMGVALTQFSLQDIKKENMSVALSS